MRTRSNGFVEDAMDTEDTPLPPTKKQRLNVLDAGIFMLENPTHKTIMCARVNFLTKKIEEFADQGTIRLRLSRRGIIRTPIV